MAFGEINEVWFLSQISIPYLNHYEGCSNVKLSRDNSKPEFQW